MSNEPTIYQVGPSPRAQGGMATVIGIYMKHYQQRFGFKLIPTYTGRGFLSNLMAYGWALIMVIQACLFVYKPLFHIHIAIGGSCFRKISLAAICRCFHKPYIMHIHAGEFYSRLQNQHPLLRRYIIDILNSSAKIVTIARCWEEEYASILDPQKLTMIYNPCPIWTENPADRENEQPVFLFAGLLCQAKGVYDLADAAKMLSQTHDFQLKIFGSGENEKLQAYIGDCRKINVFPWVDQEILINEYDHADVFVLPSYIEGLPMVVLEAMGRGLPVIAARVGGIPEIVSDGYNGFLIEAGDVDGLVQKMAALVDDKGQRVAMGRNSSQYVSRSMSLDTIAGQLAALYGE